jgi:hypothetical protein
MAVAGIRLGRSLVPLVVGLSIPAILAASALPGLPAAPRSHESSRAPSVNNSNKGASDEMGLPGCLVIAGRPILHVGCVPCPPIWLGGPGMTCVQTVSAPTASGRVSLYPGGPSLNHEDMTAPGRPLLPATVPSR